MVQSSLRLWAAYTLTDIILSHLVYWHKSKFIVIIKSVHQQHQAPPRCLSELFIRKNFSEKCLLSTLYIISKGGTIAIAAMAPTRAKNVHLGDTEGYKIQAKRKQKPRLLHKSRGCGVGALPPMYNICYCPPSHAAPDPNLTIWSCAMCK